jgi:hypothetical protein
MDPWPLFKLKTEMACQELNLMFLTTIAKPPSRLRNHPRSLPKPCMLLSHTPQWQIFLVANATSFVLVELKCSNVYALSTNLPTPEPSLPFLTNSLISVWVLKERHLCTSYVLRFSTNGFPARLNTALQAHTAYKGLDKSRYSEFQANVRAGNRRVETVSGLFADLETFDTLAIEKHARNLDLILKPASAHAVTFKKTSSNTNLTYDWKGQKDLNPNQVGFLMKKFHKGCVICHTNDHKIFLCPIIEDKLSITTKRTNNRDKTTRTTPSENGSARTASATILEDEDEDKDNNETTKETNEVKQGKSCHSISSPAPKIFSLLPSATSAQNLTPLFIPTG